MNFVLGKLSFSSLDYCMHTCLLNVTRDFLLALATYDTMGDWFSLFICIIFLAHLYILY